MDRGEPHGSAVGVGIGARTLPLRAALGQNGTGRTPEIVFIGRVTAVRTESPDKASNRVAIEVQPEFRQGRPFKGSLDAVRLVTPDNTAACGVPVEVGSTYVIFANRDPGEPGIAWFSTCNGSRQYPDARNSDVSMDFSIFPIIAW